MLSGRVVASLGLSINPANATFQPVQPWKQRLLGTDDINLFDSLHASDETDCKNNV